MDDMISRQAALNSLGEQPVVRDESWDYDIGRVKQWEYDVHAINSLPPAQPDTCDGCKWEGAFGYGECQQCKRAFDDMFEECESV